MARRLFWSSFKEKRRLRYNLPRSKRAYEFSLAEAKSLRQKVFLIVFLLIFVYLIYLLFYSSNFRITQLNISGQAEVPSEEIEKTIGESLSKSRWLLFPGDNYFFVKIKDIQKAFDQKNILVALEVSKKFPHTLNINIKEKLGRLIWVSSEQLYILERDGKIITQLQDRELVKVGLPIVYDISNTAFDLNQKVVNRQLVDLIIEIFSNFASYDLPVIELDYFKVDSPEANYVKIVTPQGFEIHVNYLTALDKQIYKLKKSLLAGKIDLNKINYINLRIENQVIYK